MCSRSLLLSSNSNLESVNRSISHHEQGLPILSERITITWFGRHLGDQVAVSKVNGVKFIVLVARVINGIAYDNRPRDPDLAVLLLKMIFVFRAVFGFTRPEVSTVPCVNTVYSKSSPLRGVDNDVTTTIN